MPVTLSQAQARTIAVASQGLDVNAATIEQVFDRVKCLQLDPLKAIRESHEVVCLARGATLHDTTTLLTASPSYQVFAYPAHAMAFVPMHFWPWFAAKRRRLRADGWRGPVVDPEAVKTVTALLHERHVVTTKDFSGGTGTGWQRVSPLRIAADWLLWTGEAISTSRNSSYREYALASKVVRVRQPFFNLLLNQRLSVSNNAISYRTLLNKPRFVGLLFATGTTLACASARRLFSVRTLY